MPPGQPGATAPASAPNANGVYWQGADGNYYVKAAGITGVQNVGKSAVNPLTGQSNFTGLTQIADPSPPVTATTTGSTGPSASQIATDNAAIQGTNVSLEALPGILQQALDAADNGYTSATGTLDQADQQATSQHDTGTTTNQQNYDANLMASLRSGAKGLSGLLSVLRGTGEEGWANNAVADTTNSDIRTGLTTQQGNQTSLDSALSGTLSDDASKRLQNQATEQSQQYAAKLNNATQMQDLYTKMAGYFNDMGDTANAVRFMGAASAQTPDIATYGTAPVSADYAKAIPVAAAPVTAFAGPTQQSVTYSPGANNTSVNPAVFSVGDARKQLAGVGA